MPLTTTHNALPPILPNPCGPIRHPNMHVMVHNDGVEAKGYRYAIPAEAAPPALNWIWQEIEDAPVALFRKEVQLARTPESIVAWLSADISYRLWINGRLAARGPADIGMDYNRTTTGKWFCDRVDLTPFFHSGVNVIAAEVFAVPLSGWEGHRGQGGLGATFQVVADGKLTDTWDTDATWQAAPGAHWSVVDKPSSHWQYDSAREPVGWRVHGFDASRWRFAVPVLDRWEPLMVSEIPPRMEAIYPPTSILRASPGVVPTPHPPFTSGQTLRLTGDGEFAVRYDRVLSAYIGVTVRGGSGATLYLQPNEPNAPGYHRMASLKLSGGTQTVELPFLDSFSVINIQAVGVTEPLEVQEVRATFVSQPVEYRGAFACSDDHLTRLWKVCRWATQLCLQTHHLDSPHHQEPISDPGDYLIESLVNYHAFFQPWLTRQDLRKYAWILRQCQNHVFHTSYALLWLQMLLDYHDYTGDTALVQELAPDVHSLLDTFTGYRGKNELLSEAPNYMFMDWVDIAGFPGHHPPAVIGQGYMTAFYYRALDDARRVAELTGDALRTAHYVALRHTTANAFERELWVPEKGLYRDGKPFQNSHKPGDWLPADKDIETFTTHVNVLAVLYGLAPKDRQRAVLEQALGSPMFTCQPYFMHFVLDAIAHAGLFDTRGLPQIRRWHIVEETQSLREMWDVGDLSHGWGATPLYQLSARVLGVQPATAGYHSARIAPMLCDLDWARGVVPTPHGNIQVSWTRHPDAIRLEVTVPHGMKAQVELPEIGLSRNVEGGHYVFQGKPLSKAVASQRGQSGDF